jgi:hypothetical protein
MEQNVAVRLLFIDFNKTSNSLGREVFYNTRIEFGIAMDLASLIIIMCLNETYKRVQLGENLFVIFPVEIG